MRVIVFAMACVIAACCFVLHTAPQSVFPPIALARVELFADVGELPSEAVRARAAAPLERALLAVPHLIATRAYADPGKLEIELDFDPHSNADDDLRAVRAAVDAVRTGLPIANVVTLIEGPEAEPVVTYAIASPFLSQARLERRIEASLGPVFTGTPGLGRITVYGGDRDIEAVTIDARALRIHRLRASDVARAIADASTPQVAGTIVRGDERLTVEVGRTLDGDARLRALPIAGTTLGALARVRGATDGTGRQASFDAMHAVLLNAYAAPNGDAVALARGVDARLATLRALLPSDARITPAWDQTQLIVASQHALWFSMAIGACIALVLVAAFLRDAALLAVTALVLPVALLFTATLLVRAGLRLDLMTLGGLTIAIGLIIDEAIVVTEAISRSLEAGDDRSGRRDAIARAVRRVARPLIASTAAIAVVFLPLSFLSGIPGFFFHALAVTIVVALAVSIALSLVAVPTFARAFGARTPRAERPRRLERAYIAGLRVLARGRIAVFGIALVAFAVAAVLLVRTPTDFLPELNEGQFEIKYAMPPGTSAAAADRLATNMELAVLTDRAVAHVARLSGIDTNGYVATPPDAGTLRVTLKAQAKPEPFDDVADRMRRLIRSLDPSVALEVHQLLEDQINDLSGAPEAMQLTVTGPDQATLAKLAGRLADRIVDVRGIVDTFDGVTWQARSIRAATTLSVDDVRARIGGIPAGTIETPAGPLPVVVRVAETQPLDRIVQFDAPELASTVQEANGARLVRVTAGIENADLSTTIARIRMLIAPEIRALPPGYAIEVGGAITQQRAAFREFTMIFAIAAVLLFGVLVATFDSFRLPLVVLASIPLAPIGVAAALAITKTPLNVASFMGLLLLAGIVVRNGILLVDGTALRVRAGMTLQEAVEGAAGERLRPILMTTFATLGALAPLALGIGAGSEMERPLAIAVIGGLVASTLLTLAVIPLLSLTIFSIRGASRPQKGAHSGG